MTLQPQSAPCSLAASWTAFQTCNSSCHTVVVFSPTTPGVLTLDIIANNLIDQKFVELSSSQHYCLVENAMYRSVFPLQGVEDGVFLPSSSRASEAFACHDEFDAC